MPSGALGGRYLSGRDRLISVLDFDVTWRFWIGHQDAPGSAGTGPDQARQAPGRRGPQAKLLACPARTAALLPQVRLLPLPGTVRMKRVPVGPPAEPGHPAACSGKRQTCVNLRAAGSVGRCQPMPSTAGTAV